MAQHDQASHHQTVTVVSSMPSPMTPHQQQQPNVSTMQQQSNTSVSSMPSLQNLPQNSQHPQQISAEWGHSRVQVIQQPLQNSTYLQQLYNAQGPLIMPGNIALHPGINSQQIQVIAAGKPFQGNQLAPHMLTTQGKQVLQGQTASAFPGYTTIPTIPTTQNQTFVFSPLGVINSQASLLSAQSQPAVSIAQHQKNTEMHKLIGGGKVSQGKVVSTSGAGAQSVPAQCVQVSQPVLGAQQPPQAQILSPLQAGGQAMQFAPWQLSGALPQMWAGGLPAGALPAGGLLAPNPIFIRGTQPEQSMFIQHSPQSSLHQNTSNPPSSTAPTVKPRASTEGMSKTPRPLSNILPGGLRPAASVSTQTIAGQQPNQVKQRGKQGVRSPAPTSKQDAANQTNKVHHQMQQPKPQLLVMNSAGQMTPLTSSAADKNVLNKAMQQQTLLHQQHQAMQQQQQQQQQQQLLQQQQQQLVQHYQQQGMALGMAQGTLPVGSVAQTNLMAAAGIPQTISMVQQIHPQLVGSALQTSVGLQQPHTLNQNTLTNSDGWQQGLALDGASFLTAPLVQVSPILQQEVSSNSVVSPQLTLQTAQGPVGLIAAPMQGAMLHMPSTTAPSATVPVANVKNEEADKQQATTQSVSAATTTEAELSPANTTADAGTSSAVEVCPSPAPASPAPAPAVITTDAAVSTTTTTSTPATSVADRIKETFSKVSIKKSESSSPPRSPGSSAGTASVSTAPAHSTASAAHTVLRSTALSMPSLSPVPTSLPTMPKYTPHSASLSTPSSVPVPHTTAATTIGMVASTSSTSVTSSITTPISSAPLFKTSHSSARHMSQASHDKGLPKAMVKPNILTHVIEGYVIQEAGEPFAVNRPLREWIADKDQDKENKLPTPDEPPRKKQMLESSSGSHSSRVTASASTSSEGASGSGLSKVKAPAPVGAGPAETSAVPKPTEEPAQSVPNAQKWSVAEVCEFIRKIPGCAGYADEFLVQEVDGEALLLIRPEHLVMALSMKLGPALKIVACIDSLRPDSDQSQHEQD